MTDAERVREALDGAHGPDQQRIAETGVSLIALLLSKNSDYKNSALTPPLLAPGTNVRTALQCRMSDKVQRFANIAGGHKPNVDEPLEETMKDLTCYGILWMADGAMTS